MTEPIIDSPHEAVNTFIGEVISKKPEEVSFLTRALLSVELTKDSINEGKILPQQGMEFAQSLIDFNTVPVVIGTPECKIFPIDFIHKARPAIIDNYRKAAVSADIDFDENSKQLSDRAQKLSDLLEMGYGVLSKQYEPFVLSPQDLLKEVTNKVQASVQAKAMLGGNLGGITSEQESAVKSFIELNFANFIAGERLKKYIQENYQFS